jgi:hypothetical protein
MKMVRVFAFLATATALIAGPSDNPFTPPNFPKPVFPDKVFNVREFGAKGDGAANDTAAINKAIAACSTAGGGTVVFPAGKYAAASVRLQSHVRLLLDKAATIFGAPAGAFDPPEKNEFSKYQDFGHDHFHNALFWGEKLEDVAVLGGTIDGGSIIHGTPKDGQGDKIFALVMSKNLHFEGTVIPKGGHFVYLLNDCENITIANTVVQSSRDAIDLMGCRNVQVYGCHFTGCGDDTLGIKSDYALGRKIKSENIYAWNCYFETHCNGVQFGSETAGDFSNVNIWDIKIGEAGKAGIGITCNDGGVIDGVRFNNISIKKATCPIYLLISDRLRSGDPAKKIGSIRNLTISNVTISDCQAGNRGQVFPCTISGMPDAPLENIVLENIKVATYGGGKKEEIGVFPIYPKDYSPRSLGPRPAAGIYIRHVRGLILRNVSFTYDHPDPRPPVVAYDVDGLELDHFDTPKTASPNILQLEKVKNLRMMSSAGLPDKAEAKIEKTTF